MVPIETKLWLGSELEQPSVKEDRLLLRGRSQNQLSVAPRPMSTHSGIGVPFKQRLSSNGSLLPNRQ